MNIKIKKSLLGLKDLSLFSGIIYLLIWLPLFILGEVRIINDDIGSQVGLFGLPFMITIILFFYAFYSYKKKGKYYVFGFLLPAILISAFLLFALIGIILSGEM